MRDRAELSTEQTLSSTSISKASASFDFCDASALVSTGVSHQWEHYFLKTKYHSTQTSTQQIHRQRSSHQGERIVLHLKPHETARHTRASVRHGPPAWPSSARRSGPQRAQPSRNDTSSNNHNCNNNSNNTNDNNHTSNTNSNNTNSKASNSK